MARDFSPRYLFVFKQAGITTEVLPEKTKNLIALREQISSLLMKANDKEQNKWLPILVQTDAVIASDVFKLYKDRITEHDPELEELLLKAKSLSPLLGF